MPCPEPDELARFADGLATAEESEALSKHIDTCAACREVLVTLARTSKPGVVAPPPPADLPEKGATVGRYVVLEPRGAGGMGLVVSAYDGQLDRKVALKLVRPDVEAEGGTAHTRARLIREAQLMARVRHPNVLTVYEVGERGDQVFIAMELVEGHTLRAWLKDKPRTRDEILGVFLQSGRALAAAHTVGVVHRDFKPDNVLIDRSGRAQVTDFGLAFSGAPPSGTPLDSASPEVRDGHPTGIAGTPAYMAPEQLAGRGADGRSDQFSFCVALWEALCGARPYQADDMRGLRRAIAAHSIIAPRIRVPRRLERALRRGLEPDPERRFADMGALLVALTPRVQRPALWLTAVAAALAAIVTFALERPDTGCAPDAALQGIWDTRRQAEVQRAFGDDTRAYTAVSQAFERRSGEWRSTWKGACEATRVRGVQTEEQLGRQRVCLDRRLDELRALSDLFVNPGPGVVDNAGLAVALLKPAARCLSGEAFDAMPLPSEARPRQTIAQARLELARASAHASSGQNIEAVASAESALALARLANYPPVEADAYLAEVEPLRELARLEEAEKALAAAALAAEAGRHFEAQLRVAVSHIRLIDSARTEEADGWIRRAEAILAHASRPDLQAELDNTVAILRLAQRRTVESRARATAALDYFEKTGEVAQSLAARHIAALALRSQGKPVQALAELQSAFDGYVAALGPSHPLTLHVHMHVCEALLDLGRPSEALAALETPELLAAGHLTAAWEINRDGLRGAALLMQGKLSKAAALQRKGLDRANGVAESKRLLPGARRWLIPTLRAQEDFVGTEQTVNEVLHDIEGGEHPPLVAVHATRLELALLEAAEGKTTPALERARRVAADLAPLLDAAAPERVAAQLALARIAALAHAPAEAAQTAEALLALGLDEPARSRAALVLGLVHLGQGDKAAEAVVVSALETLDRLRIFPDERLAALSQLDRPQPTLAPCPASPAWAEVEYGPRAQQRKDAVVKRHCAGQTILHGP